MNQNDFNLNENQSSYTENYAPETPSVDDFDTSYAENKGKRFADRIKVIFSSKAFFTAVIAYTVVAGASLIAGSVDIFAILFAIGMWMAYSMAKRETPFKEMKFLSGVLKAYYIVAIIGIVCMFIAATLCIVFAPNVMTLDTEIDAGLDALENGNGDSYVNFYMELDGETLEELDEIRGEIKDLGMSIADFLGIIMIVLGVVLIIGAVVTIIINELFVRKLRKQLENSIDAIASNSEAELSLRGIKIWFIVIGVLTAVSAAPMLAEDLILAANEVASAVACFALASALNSEKTSKISGAPANDRHLL